MDQLLLAHTGTSLYTDLPGFVIKLFFGSVFIILGPSAFLTGIGRIGNPGCFLLAITLVSQGFVLVFVFDSWIWHIILILR